MFDAVYRQEGRRGYVRSFQWWFEWFPSGCLFCCLQQWNSACSSGPWRWVTAWCPSEAQKNDHTHERAASVEGTGVWRVRLIAESCEIPQNGNFFGVVQYQLASTSAVVSLPSFGKRRFYVRFPWRPHQEHQNVIPPVASYVICPVTGFYIWPLNITLK